MKDKQKQEFEKQIRDLEIENAKLKGENEILRQWKELPPRPQIIREIERRPKPFPIPLKRHPDVSPFKPFPRIQKGKTQFEIPMLKQ